MNLEYEKCRLYYIFYDKQSNVISGYWLWQASFNRALKLAMLSTSGDFVLYWTLCLCCKIYWALHHFEYAIDYGWRLYKLLRLYVIDFGWLLSRSIIVWTMSHTERSLCHWLPLIFGPRQTNLVLIAYASSEGSGEPAHPRSLARTFAARSYKQWVKRNLQTESQIPGPSEWLGMRS